MIDKSIYSDELYASTFTRRVRRAAQLGCRYYLSDLPRYFLHRRQAGLNWFDGQASVNPVVEFFSRRRHGPAVPRGYDEALKLLRAAGVTLTLPPSRVLALLKCWEQASAASGEVVECGSYRGATALLIALMSKLNGRRQKMLVLDTFSGSPQRSQYDSPRPRGEYQLPHGYAATLRHQAVSVGVADRLEVFSGTFRETFDSLERRPLQFSFGHIDANLYESTLDACAFVIPRLSKGGILVFDDYNGPCDLGARLAIDRYLAKSRRRPVRLAGSSAFIQA